MSLELLVIWVQFCRSALDHHVDAATALTIQLLREVRSLALDVHSPAGQAACRELVMLLFTDLLPRNYNSNSEHVEHVLKFLQSPSSNNDPPTCAAWSVKGNIAMSRDVIQQCLCFCNTDDGNWPAWLQDTFRDCRIALQAMLREIYHHRIKMEDERKHRQRKSSANNGDESAAAGVEKNTDTNERPEESASTRLILSHDQTLSFRNPKSWKVACVNLLRWIRERLTAAASSSSSSFSALSPQQRHRLQMLLLSVCLMYGWRRHRHRIAAAGRGALATVFWRPALEILEALLGIRASH